MQSRDTHRPGRTFGYKGINQLESRNASLDLPSPSFLPLEPSHLPAPYGDPWNDFGGIFWSSPPSTCGAVNSGWDKAMRRNVTCRPAKQLRAEHSSLPRPQLSVPSGHSTAGDLATVTTAQFYVGNHNSLKQTFSLQTLEQQSRANSSVAAGWRWWLETTLNDSSAQAV